MKNRIDRGKTNKMFTKFTFGNKEGRKIFLRSKIFAFDFIVRFDFDSVHIVHTGKRIRKC